MANTTEQESPIRDHTIIDADVHCPISIEEDVAPRLDEPYQSIAGPTSYGPGSSCLLEAGWPIDMDGQFDRPEVRDGDDIQEHLCEPFHVDTPILNNFPQDKKLGNRRDLINAIQPVQNDIFIERYLDDHDDFLGLAGISTRDPAKAAEEIDRLGSEKQIIGGYITSVASHLPLGDPDFDVLYQAAEDNDWVIAFHANTVEFPVAFPRQETGFREYLSVHVNSHTWSQMETLTSLIVQGVPEKFPDLNFIFLEAGISWVPYMMWRLNKEYSMRKMEAPLLQRSPEEYIRDSFYFTTQPLGEPNDPNSLAQMIEIVGTENIMFSSDFPHWDMDHPEALDKLLRRLFTPKQRQQVLQDTATEAFKLD